jgi:FkbM family methyltransferase
LGVRVPPSALFIQKFRADEKAHNGKSQSSRRSENLQKNRIKNYFIGLAGILEGRAQLYQGKGWGSSTVNYEVEAAARLLGDNTQLCIDVGGNVGSYTKALLLEFETQIIVFEPNEKNYLTLLEMFAENKSVKLENLALSDKSGVATLHADLDGSGLASLTKRRLDHHGIPFDFSEQVKTVRFEDYWRDKLGSPEISLLKLDIEGHELIALHGLGNAINHIELIQFEFGGCNIDTRSYFQDFWYFFTQHSFEIFRLGPLGLQKIETYSEKDEYFSTTNYFAKRKITRSVVFSGI